MYKGHSEHEHYIRREGSHSTKPFRTGDNSHLANSGGLDSVDYKAASCAESVKRVLELKKEKHALTLEVQRIQAEIIHMNATFKNARSTEEYSRNLDERKRLGKQSLRTAKRLSEVNAKIKELDAVINVPSATFTEVFMDVCRKTLPNDVLEPILEASREIHKRIKMEE